MKAMILKGFGGLEQFELQDVPTPKPQAGEVLVRVRANGLCYHDVLARQGHFPRTKVPGIIGHEIAGEVAALGSGVADFKVGERVVLVMRDHCGQCRECVRGRDNLCQKGGGLFGEEIPGGYAEYLAVRTQALLRIPESVSYEQAAVVPCALGTAYHGLHGIARVLPAESVLITGASGGVGIHAVQVARLLGARVFAVTTSATKTGFLKEHGADEVIVSPNLDFAQEARRLTGGAGVDVIFNIVGEMAWAASLKAMAFGARHIFVGNLNAAPVTLRPAHAVLKEFALLGTSDVTRHEVETLLELVRLGRIKPVVGACFPLAQAVQAHTLMESRGATGRIILTP